MSKGFLLIDGSNIAHACNNIGKLTHGDVEVQALYGFLRMLRTLVKTYGTTMTPMVLWDGVSWRKTIFPEYKASRSKVATTKTEIKSSLALDSLKVQLPMISKAMSMLGVAQMKALNMEADDLAGIVVMHQVPKKSVLLISADRDWIQLVGPKVGWVNPINNNGMKRIFAKNIEEETGVKNGQEFLEMKAIMGDKGDDIPGVGGIGEVGAVDLIKTYGTVQSFMNQVATGEVKNLPKKYQDFADTAEKYLAFKRNIDLMDLRTTIRPLPVNLKITKGEFDKAQFEEFCSDYLFTSITSKFDEWIAPFGDRHG